MKALRLYTHTHTHTHSTFIQMCAILLCNGGICLLDRELYLTKISFDFCAKKSNKVEEIKQEDKQKNKRMDYIKNSLSFLCAKIYVKQKQRKKCVKNILINKDEYA